MIACDQGERSLVGELGEVLGQKTAAIKKAPGGAFLRLELENFKPGYGADGETRTQRYPLLTH